MAGFRAAKPVENQNKSLEDSTSSKIGERDVKPHVAHVYKVSDPSQSIDEINIPEVTNQTAEFIYNFYTVDERVKPARRVNNVPLSKVSRYSLLKWTAPKLSDFESTKEDRTRNDNVGVYSIASNAAKVVSEDNFFNPHYVTHTFSDVDAIEQGASDLETYSRISRHDAESVYKMAKYQLSDIAGQGETSNSDYQRQFSTLADSLMTLADFPKTSLGLRVYDTDNKLNDDDDLLRSITKSVSLSMKINSTVIPDVFENSKAKTLATNFEALKVRHQSAKSGAIRKTAGLNITPVKNDFFKTSAAYLSQPVKLIGYVIDRYRVTADGFKKEDQFYIEDITQTSYADPGVRYGESYVYSIRVVASVKILAYAANGRSVDISTIYVASRPMSVPVECYEYVPPPEPENLKFVFDHSKKNLMLFWDMPVNPQRDVTQFQVFRRKSIQAPFELIAQYGFDKTVTVDGERYKTGETVDANNFKGMSDDLKYLVSQMTSSNYMHRDEEFTVDTEMFVSSEYIYSICAVDAHGMISNYSTQYKVTFDVYKNRLKVQVICDKGSPRQYPNMNLRLDAFKDVIKVSGDNARQMTVYFTPEYLKLKDGVNPKITHKIVEAQTTNENSYYVLQLINLDSQKSKILRINIKDPQYLTL